MNNYNALGKQARKAAEAIYDAHRRAVDEKVHTGYGTESINAALSPDGRGLTNYGAITLELREVSMRTGRLSCVKTRSIFMIGTA